MMSNILQANALAPNWGQIIFQSANEIAANQMFKQKLADIESQKDLAKEKYAKRKAAAGEAGAMNGNAAKESRQASITSETSSQVETVS